MLRILFVVGATAVVTALGAAWADSASAAEADEPPGIGQLVDDVTGDVADTVDGVTAPLQQKQAAPEQQEAATEPAPAPAPEPAPAPAPKKTAPEPTGTTSQVLDLVDQAVPAATPLTDSVKRVAIPVTDVVDDVTGPVLDPAVEPLTRSLTPVARSVGQLSGPILDPVVRPLTPTLHSLSDAAAAATRPIPILAATSDPARRSLASKSQQVADGQADLESGALQTTAAAMLRNTWSSGVGWVEPLSSGASETSPPAMSMDLTQHWSWLAGKEHPSSPGTWVAPATPTSSGSGGTPVPTAGLPSSPSVPPLRLVGVRTPGETSAHGASPAKIKNRPG